MPETAIYDLISSNHNAMLMRNRAFKNEKVYRSRRDNLENQNPKLISPKEIPYEDYDSDSGSDSENGTYESLIELSLRKQIEIAHRQSKIARVTRTGHPLFDHLREERAIKELPRKKTSPKMIKKPVENNRKSVENSKKLVESNGPAHNMPANNSFLHRREGIMHKTQTLNSSRPQKSLSNSHLTNLNQIRGSKGMTHSVSLQQMSSMNRGGPVRKHSEGPVAQTFPRQFYQNRDMARSEQNLYYLRGEVPNFQRHPYQMQRSDQQMFEFQARQNGRGFQRKHTTDSSDSDSDWIIPRPKFGHKKPNKNNKTSDDSDVSAHFVRSKR